MAPKKLHYLEEDELPSKSPGVGDPSPLGRDEMPTGVIPSFRNDADHGIGNIDTALLLVPDVKVTEGAQKLLAPFPISLPGRGEVVVVVEEAGTRVSREVRAMLRGRESGQVSSWFIYPKGEVDALREDLSKIHKDIAKQAKKRTTQPPFIFIEGFPAASEDEIAQLVEGVRALCGDGAAVLATMEAEAYQFVEALPEAVVVRTKELLYRMPYRDDEGTRAAWSRTHGIPMLVDPLRKGGEPAVPRYDLALTQVVAATLRCGLPEEERRLRLAMVLLGSGTFEELTYAVPRLDRETFDLLAEEAPFLGVNPVEATFECAGVGNTERLKGCYTAIRSVEGIDDDVWLRTAETLCQRGDYVRAAFCCGLCASQELQCKSVLRWGVEFCFAGSLRIVRDGLSLARRLYMEEEEGYRLTNRAYRVMTGKASRAIKADETLVGGHVQQPDEHEYAYVTLLAACRRLTSGAKALKRSATYVDTMTVPMLEHITALMHILGGRPSQAVQEISTGAAVGWPTCLPEALLVNDLRLATALIGETPSPGLEPVFERSRRLLEETREKRYVAYQRAIPEVLAVIAGGQSGALLDQAESQAERCGDLAVQAALLVVGAVSDLRRKSWVPAHVRASHAAVILRGTENRYLRQVALLIDAVALTAKGEPGFLRELAMSADDLRSIPCDLARLLVAAGCDGPLNGEVDDGPRPVVPREALRLQTLSRAHLSHDALWLTYVLANDCGAISGLFALQLPRAWRRALGEAGFGSVDKAGPPGKDKTTGKTDYKAGVADAAPSKGPLMLDDDTKSGNHAVYLTLLGGFSATLDGRQVAQEGFSRRHAIVLLSLLGMAPGHTLRRGELIEAVWPSHDARSGSQRLYESISTTRSLFGCQRNGFDIFRLNKAEGTIAFDPAVVTCDIDLFEEAVSKATMNEGLHEAVVERASQARSLYRGDLDCAVVGDVPEATTRRDELRGMFATAMVAGARAATATERRQLAVQFAQDAHAADRIREDAIAVLMESLCLAGRTAEGQQAYAQYSAHLIATVGLPPSRTLRELAASLFPMGGEDGGMTALA